MIALLKKILGSAPASKFPSSSHARQSLPGTSGQRSLHVGTSAATQGPSNVQLHSGNKRHLETSALERPDKHKQHRTGENGMNRSKRIVPRKFLKEANLTGLHTIFSLKPVVNLMKSVRVMLLICSLFRWSS